MKKLAVFFLAIMTVSFATSSKFTESTQYSDTVGLTGVPDDLFTNIDLWLTGTFSDTGSKIEMADKSAGLIKGEYIFTLPYKSRFTATISSSFIVEIKDKGYRISFNNAYFQQNDEYGRPLGEKTYLPSKKIADSVIHGWTELADELKADMLTSSQGW